MLLTVDIKPRRLRHPPNFSIEFALPTQARAAIGAAMMGGIQLDANGKGQTQPGPPGTVYILCVIRNRTNGQSQIWNFKVELKPGPNSVTLDQRNAT